MPGWGALGLTHVPLFLCVCRSLLDDPDARMAYWSSAFLVKVRTPLPHRCPSCQGLRDASRMRGPWELWSRALVSCRPCQMVVEPLCACGGGRRG